MPKRFFHTWRHHASWWPKSEPLHKKSKWIFDLIYLFVKFEGCISNQTSQAMSAWRELPKGGLIKSAPTPATSVIRVRDLHHEVRLDMRIIFMYNMSTWGGSWGSGCGLRARFRRRRRRRRRRWRSGTFTMKSGLTWGSFLCILCLYRVVPGVRDAADGHVFVADVGAAGHRGPGPPPRSPAWQAS